MSGVCIVLCLLDLDFCPASFTYEQRTSNNAQYNFITAYGQEKKVVNDYIYALYTACCNVYYTWFVYLFIDVVVTFETLICSISNAIAKFIHWRHYRPTCSELLIKFSKIRMQVVIYISYCLSIFDIISLVKI